MIDFRGFLWAWFVENVLRNQFPILYQLVIGGTADVDPIRLQVRNHVWTLGPSEQPGKLKITRVA